MRELSNVRREEEMKLGDRAFAVSYGQRRIAELVKEVQVRDAAAATRPTDTGGAVVERQLGQGRDYNTLSKI
ncbi:hypothetical protein [Paenibacillus sp. HW567]|uniref:hypothetical protein n=1 Tax=Paenibacillus sp. HW567 TaxID=1034769 RepID=UPI00039B82ED|nr:hypothetical protein [Paenibacillus sp. HW567]